MGFKGFQKVKLTKPQRSTFDLTHDRRMSIPSGACIPCLITEAVPSDSFSGSTEMLVRLAPLLAPIYDQVWIYVHFYFVPNRLLWESWEEFITGGRLGVGVDPVTAPVPPYFDLEEIVEAGLTAKGGLFDYLGVPILPFTGKVSADYAGLEIDAMPVLVYQLIWQEYYSTSRNFSDDAPAQYPYPDGIVTLADANADILNRGYGHDYFTSALPFTQRGEEVLLPVDVRVTQALDASDNEPTGTAGAIEFDNLGTIRLDMGGSPVTTDGVLVGQNAISTMNDFRAAMALQVWLERNAVGGSRYTESTQAHFGVRPQDSRLQRPEYIGGGRVPVKISEVVATAYSTNSDDDVVPLANMAGHGVTYGNTNSFRYFCTEHGFIMGIVSALTPASYHQGLPRMFRRKSFLDYPWPTFAKLGEQEVHKYEIFASPANMTEDASGDVPLFGYQSRYADWKYVPSTNHGDYHDDLLFWTTTRDFDETDVGPSLSASFIDYDRNAFNRMFAVSGDFFSRNIWLYIHNRLTVKRPLPYFGTPNTFGFS